MGQYCPQSNHLTHTTIAIFQVSATQGTWDTLFASPEKAQYNLHIPRSLTIAVWQ